MAATSECSEGTFDCLGSAARRERLELWPEPKTLPPRTRRDPCLVSNVDCSASAAAAVRKRSWRLGMTKRHKEESTQDDAPRPRVFA